MIKPRAEIKIKWATNGGDSGMKFFKIILFRPNMAFRTFVPL